MNDALEFHLSSLVRNNIVVDWRSSPGYGMIEYTVEFEQTKSPGIKNFAKDLTHKFKAFDFSTYRDGGLAVLKFVVKL